MTKKTMETYTKNLFFRFHCLFGSIEKVIPKNFGQFEISINQWFLLGGVGKKLKCASWFFGKMVIAAHFKKKLGKKANVLPLVKLLEVQFFF